MDLIYYILGAVVLILLIVLILYLVARGKGKITINLSKFDYSPGEKIKGSLTLQLKKPVDAKSLNVALIGIQRNTRMGYTGKGVSRSTREALAFEFKKPIDGEKTYAGTKVYNFEILVPRDLLANRTLQEGAIGTIVKSAQILSGNMSSIKWYIKANIDMKGFDLSKKVQVNIG
jgi:hypothetical protein